MKFLTAVPVYNEERSVENVLREVLRYSPDVLVVNDGSTDRTGEILEAVRGELELWRATDWSAGDDWPRLRVLSHPQNRGYGAALISAFAYALEQDIDVLVTMDCDGQHEPGRIPVLLEAIGDADIVSGSRYLRDFRQNDPAPQERRQINGQITEELNTRFGLELTDAFCGFKAYRRTALERLRITEPGWGMPLQLWVQAARLGLRIKEVGVPRVYLDPNRAFGGVMNDAEQRLAYYRTVIDAADVAAERATPACCGGTAGLGTGTSLLAHPRCRRETCW
jgi:dolichol-phosphate mannosyltransferase